MTKSHWLDLKSSQKDHASLSSKEHRLYDYCLILSHTCILMSGGHIFGFPNSCLPKGILISIQFSVVNMTHHFTPYNISFNVADPKDDIFNWVTLAHDTMHCEYSGYSSIEAKKIF